MGTYLGVVDDCFDGLCMFVCLLHSGAHHQLGVSGMRGELSLSLFLSVSLFLGVLHTQSWGSGAEGTDHPPCVTEQEGIIHGGKRKGTVTWRASTEAVGR